MGKLLYFSSFSNGRGRHFHTMYVPDEMSAEVPVIETSEDGSSNQKHRHSFDIMSGQIIPALEGPAAHLHELVGEIPLSAKTDSSSEDDKVADVVKLFTDTIELEKDSFADANESEKFFVGDQWPGHSKTKLEGEERAALSFNHLQASAKTLSGFQRRNRSDFKFYPVEGGDERVANILDVVAKVICDNNHFAQEETEWFMDALIAGRGNMRIWSEMTEDLEEEIKIRHLDWKDVVYGRHFRKDIEDLKVQFVSRWVYRDELEAMYPEKKSQLKDVSTGDQYNMNEEKEHLQVAGEQYSLGRKQNPYLYDPVNGQIRLIECWRKEVTRSKIAISLSDAATFRLSDYDSKFTKSIESLPDFETVKVPVTRMRVTELAGEILLNDEYLTDDVVPIQDFHVIPVYCDKVRDYFWSKIHVAKDAQMEINKRLSQFVDILNRYAVYCHFYYEETFADHAELNDYIENATKVGGVYKLADGQAPPMREEGSKIPAEIITAQKEMLFQLRELLNINPELLGSAAANNYQSGAAMSQRISQALVGNEYLFDNLKMAKQKLGRMLVRYIQFVYRNNPEGIVNILGTQAMRTQVKIAGQEVDPQNNEMMQELMRLVTDADLAKYDIVVEETLESPSMRMQLFLTLSELARNGMPIPMGELINLSPIPRDIKDNMIQQIEAQQQQQAQIDQLPYQTEIQKTLINAQGKAAERGGQIGQQPQV